MIWGILSKVTSPLTISLYKLANPRVSAGFSSSTRDAGLYIMIFFLQYSTLCLVAIPHRNEVSDSLIFANIPTNARIWLLFLSLLSTFRLIDVKPSLTLCLYRFFILPPCLFSYNFFLLSCLYGVLNFCLFYPHIFINFFSSICIRLSKFIFML